MEPPFDRAALPVVGRLVVEAPPFGPAALPVADPLVAVDPPFDRAAHPAVDRPELTGPVATAGRPAGYSPVAEPKG